VSLSGTRPFTDALPEEGTNVLSSQLDLTDGHAPNIERCEATGGGKKETHTDAPLDRSKAHEVLLIYRSGPGGIVRLMCFTQCNSTRGSLSSSAFLCTFEE
jgi:hypothetical protein